MATLRLILFDKTYAQLDAVDLPLGITPTELGPGAAVTAARKHFWDNYVIPDLAPILKTREALISHLEMALEQLQKRECKNELLKNIKATLAEAQLINETAIPEDYRKRMKK